MQSFFNMLHCYSGVNISRFSTMQKKKTKTKTKTKTKKEKRKRKRRYVS